MLGENWSKRRKKFAGFFILFIILLLFALNVASPSTGYSLGDNFLTFLGLKVYSAENFRTPQEGYHYFTLVTLILAIIGYWGVSYFWKDIHPLKIGEFILIIFLLSMLANPLYQFAYETQFVWAKNLSAIDYYPNASSMIFDSDEDGFRGRYTLVLENHSKQAVEFWLQVQGPYSLDPPNPDMVWLEVVEASSGSSRKFALAGKEKKALQFEVYWDFADNPFNNQDIYRFERLQGYRPHIVLYQENALRAFGVTERILANHSMVFKAAEVDFSEPQEHSRVWAEPEFAEDEYLREPG